MSPNVMGAEAESPYTMTLYCNLPVPCLSMMDLMMPFINAYVSSASTAVAEIAKARSVSVNGRVPSVISGRKSKHKSNTYEFEFYL